MRHLVALTTIVALSCCIAATSAAGHAGFVPGFVPSVHPQVLWAAGQRPLSDAAAAALVTSEPEIRPGNARYNNREPTRDELLQFRRALDRHHRTPVQNNRLYAYVDGHDGLSHPSTDMLIQWAAHKWGIPEDMFRALAVQESSYYMYWPGDIEKVPASWVAKYPAQVRVSATRVYESMGLTQIHWKPDGSMNAGTQTLRWVSTAFNLDYAGATIRYYFNGLCKPCGHGYKRGEAWISIGAWNEPTPWNNAKARGYIARIKAALARHDWTSPWY